MTQTTSAKKCEIPCYKKLFSVKNIIKNNISMPSTTDFNLNKVLGFTNVKVSKSILPSIIGMLRPWTWLHTFTS